MSAAPAVEIIDFHCHHVPAIWPLPVNERAAPAERERWTGINHRLADPAALFEAIEAGDIDGRVINIPTALFTPPEAGIPDDLVRRANDTLAELVGRHPGRLYGLASVDAFAGEAGAREVHRAARQLGLHGVFLNSAKGEILLDAPEARPTLHAAAALNLPVFVHPIYPAALSRQLQPYGQLGILLARGTVNAATLVALLKGGTFHQMPGLRVVVTTLALGAVLLAAALDDDGESSPTTIRETLRRQVFIDTMGLHPALIKASIDVLGIGNVLLGTDWPIVNDAPVRTQALAALKAAGLKDAELQAVAADNTRRLFGLEPSQSAGPPVAYFNERIR
jgi:predicted TIM-barrel fold metal-dependent hydrolase